MKYVLLLTLCLLGACAAVPKPVAPLPVVPQKQTVNIDPELLTPCDALTPFAVKEYTQQQLLSDVLAPLVTRYRVCAARQQALACTARKAFNLPPSSDDPFCVDDK